jgi:hypothetical protein
MPNPVAGGLSQQNGVAGVSARSRGIAAPRGGMASRGSVGKCRSRGIKLSPPRRPMPRQALPGHAPPDLASPRPSMPGRQLYAEGWTRDRHRRLPSRAACAAGGGVRRLR